VGRLVPLQQDVSSAVAEMARRERREWEEERRAEAEALDAPPEGNTLPSDALLDGVGRCQTS